jgi:methyl-accepting chemotaxis protein
MTLGLQRKLILEHLALGVGVMLVLLLSRGRASWVQLVLVGVVVLLFAAGNRGGWLRLSRLRTRSARGRGANGPFKDELDELFAAQDAAEKLQRELAMTLARAEQSVSDPSRLLAGEASELISGYRRLNIGLHRIAEGGKTQSAALERALVAMSQLAESLRLTDELSEDATAVTLEATANAMEGLGVAAMVSERMSRASDRIVNASMEIMVLALRTQEIGAAVTSIVQVAEQTRLLGLKARIEAALAGEYGHGFTVVAEEVRKLADSVTRSADQINDLTRRISEPAVAIAMTMKDDSEHLEEGVADIEKVVRATQAISDSAREAMSRVEVIRSAARVNQRVAAEALQALRRAREMSRTHELVTAEVSDRAGDELRAAVARYGDLRRADGIASA